MCAPQSITDQLKLVGLDFVGMAMVADNRGWLHLTRILPDPPYFWYRSHANEIHERLYVQLQRLDHHVSAESAAW
jgi:hypothetical protein